MTAFTIEDLAATSDDAAVRRRFDARNLIWLTVFLFFFLRVSILELLTNLARRTSADIAIAAPNVVLVTVNSAGRRRS